MARLLSKKSVAARCDVSGKTIDRWIDAGKFPAAAVTLPGGGLRWLEHDVELWLCRLQITPPPATPVKGKTGVDK